MMFIKGSAIVLVVDGYPTIKCERSLFSNIESNNMVMAIVRTSNDAFFLTIRLTEMSSTSSLWQVIVIVKPLATDIKIIGSDLTVYTICESGIPPREERLPYAGNLTAQAITIALAVGQTQEIPQDICVHLISRPKSYRSTSETNLRNEDPYLPDRYHMLAEEYPSILDSFNNNNHVERRVETFDSDNYFAYLRRKHPLSFLEPQTDFENGQPFSMIDLSLVPIEKDDDISVIMTAQRKATHAFNAVKRLVETRLEVYFERLTRSGSL